jgi:hypothetical protein
MGRPTAGEYPSTRPPTLIWTISFFSNRRCVAREIAFVVFLPPKD